MKLEDIRLGQTLTVSHMPEYILSNDGISKILCKNIFIEISDYIGKTGEVSVMWFGEKCPHIGIDLFDAPPIYFPPEALSPAPQHFPTNNDIQVDNTPKERTCDNYVFMIYDHETYMNAEQFWKTIKKYNNLKQFLLDNFNNKLQLAYDWFENGTYKKDVSYNEQIELIRIKELGWEICIRRSKKD